MLSYICYHPPIILITFYLPLIYPFSTPICTPYFYPTQNLDEIITGVTGQEDPLAASFFKYALRDVCGAHAVINADTVLEHSPIDVSVNKTDTTTLSGSGRGRQLFPDSVYNAAKQRPDGMTSPTFLSAQLSSSTPTNTTTTTTTSSAMTEPPPPATNNTDKPPVSGNIWARNTYLSLPIDELMERCINLIDELEAHDVDAISNTQDTHTTTSTTSSLSGEPLLEPEKLLKRTGVVTVSPLPTTPKDAPSTKPTLTSQELIDSVLAAASNSSYPSTDRSPLTHTGPFSLLTPHTTTPITTAPSAPTNTTNSGNVKGTTGAVKTQRAIHDGLLLPVQVIISGFRSIRHPHTRMLSIMLLVRFGIQCSDDIILHRIVPSLLYAVEDAYPQVRATAVRALCTLLSTVNRVDMIESNIFPQYIFPVLNTKIVKDPEIIVRIAFAESIPKFAEAAKLFLDQTHTALQQKAQAATDNDNTITTTTTTTTTSTASPIKSSKENKEGRESAGNASNAATAATPSVKDRQNRMKEFVPLVQFQYTTKLKALHDTVSAHFLYCFYVYILTCVCMCVFVCLCVDTLCVYSLSADSLVSCYFIAYIYVW